MKAGYLGVYPQDVSKEEREKRGISEKEGLLLRNVSPDGPADKAGLKAKDIILTMQGNAVTTKNLRSILQRFGSGKTLNCVVLRDTEKITIDLMLGERP